MRVVDTLPLKLGAVLYPEHQKVKSLMIEEINNHGIDYEHKKVDAYAKGLEHFDYYSPLSDDKYKEFREWIQIQAEIYARDILNYDTSDFESSSKLFEDEAKVEAVINVTTKSA